MTTRTLRVAAAVAFVTLTILWLAFLRPSSLGGSTHYIIVSGTSMEPTLRSGDLVLVRERDAFEVGDVIAFHVPDQGADDDLVIHRVVGGSANDGYITRGDNRAADDQWRTAHDDVLGRRVVRVPLLGGIADWLAQPFVSGAIVGAAVASIIWALREVMRRQLGTPHHLASPSEVVALRIHREYKAASNLEERVRVRRMAFDVAGALANEEPGFDKAAFLRTCATYAYDGDTAMTSTGTDHQR